MIYSYLATRTIKYTPTIRATTSLMDCLKLQSSKRLGMTFTVAIYMKPPAVNGSTHELATSPEKI